MVRSAKRKSERESLKPTAQVKKKKPLSNNQPEICKLLIENGLVLPDDPEKPFEIGEDQAIFTKKICKISQSFTKQKIKSLVESLEMFWQDNSRFCQSLLPTVTSDDCPFSSRGKQQDSLLHMLLSVDELQMGVANLLLEKIPEIDFNTDLVSTATRLGDMDLAQHIVGQLKFLDHVVDSKALAQKILEVISVSNVDIQKELITCLPEIIDDDNHEEVANQLQQMLKNSQLVTCTLDALSNMNLKGDLLDEIRTSVMKILESADLGDLPVVIKFLQNTSNDENIIVTLSEFREKLQLASFVVPHHSSTPFERNNQKKQLSDEMLIFDAMKCGIRFQKIVADSWVKVLEYITKAKDQKILDIFILIVLYSFKHKRKSLNTLIRNKVKNGIFTEENVAAAFHSHPQVFGEYLKELLTISEILLRAADATVSSYGGNLYKQMFICFDKYSQQEVIGALITHVGSGVGMEVDASFEVTKSLAEEETTKLAAFTIFFKGLLDYLANLNISQVRILFSIISRLTIQSQNNDVMSIVNDDIYIVIRKQLSSKDLKYKRIGIIGGMTSLGNIMKKDSSVLNVGASGSGRGNEEREKAVYEQVIGLLKAILDNVKSSVDATALFYDELALLLTEISSVDEKILSWISDKVVADFQDEFLADADDIKKKSDDNLCLMYDLDDPEEGGIAVNIYPLLTQNTDPNLPSSSTSSVKQNKLLVLSAMFRLVIICEKLQNEGSLEGIGALLGCPLVLPDEKVLDKWQSFSDDELRTNCLALFYAINWTRELLNGFTEEEVDAEVRGKIIARIKTLISLNHRLETLFASSSNLMLPITDFSINEDLLSSLKPPSSSSKEGKKQKKTKNTKKDTQDTTTSAATTTINNDGEQASSGKEDDEGDKDGDHSNSGDVGHVSLYSFPASFRQLELGVLYALTYDGVSRAYMDTELHTKTKEDLSLSASDVDYLLNDLERKLEYSLGPNKRCFLKQSASKVIGFSHLPNDVGVVKFTKKILPSLLQHFKNAADFFKNEESVTEDGLEDSDHFSSIYIHLIKCFTLLFNWKLLKQCSHKKELASLVDIFVKELCETSKKNASIEEKIKLLLDTLQPEGKELPNLNIAVNLCKMLNSIMTHSDEDYVEIKRDYFLKLIKHKWNDTKGSQFNERYTYLIRSYVQTCKDPLDVIDEFCKKQIHEVMETSRTEDFPCLTRVTLIAFYRSFFEELISYVKTRMSWNVQEAIRSEQIADKRLATIHKALKVFQTLNNLAKEMDNRNSFMSTLKYSKLFLEVFLRNAMPLLDRTLRTHKELVHGILKTAQQSTRSLQHLCGHSKINKDVAMTTHVPALKKCLETFIFRVKAVLAYNNCDSVFWLGNLKNRDLQGNEIQSQTNPSEAQDEKEEEEGAGGEESMENDEEENDECSESF